MQWAFVMGRENNTPPTEREAISQCVTSPWHSATRGGMDQSEIILPAALLASLPPRKNYGHPHSEVGIELHFPFDEELKS